MVDQRSSALDELSNFGIFRRPAAGFGEVLQIASRLPFDGATSPEVCPLAGLLLDCLRCLLGKCLRMRENVV